MTTLTRRAVLGMLGAGGLLGLGYALRGIVDLPAPGMMGGATAWI